ncbi:hypothetical protein Bca101_059302 [Brassica carinata]
MGSRLIFLICSFLDPGMIEQDSKAVWFFAWYDAGSTWFGKKIWRDPIAMERSRELWREIRLLVLNGKQGCEQVTYKSYPFCLFRDLVFLCPRDICVDRGWKFGILIGLIMVNLGIEMGFLYLQDLEDIMMIRLRVSLYIWGLGDVFPSSAFSLKSIIISFLISFLGFFGFCEWVSMTQGQWITKSGGKMVEGPKPGLKISVPRFDNSGLIASYAKTLIGRCMNPPKQAMKMLLFMLPRIWQVEGRVVGTDLGRGRFQFAFEREEDIVEVLKMGPFHFDSWMISLVRWKPVVEINYPSKIIFWVYALDIPLQFWAAQTFQSIGDALGKVHGEVDIEEGRVRVEVEGFKPLVFTMTIDFDEGVEIPVALRYEKLVGYCTECFCMTYDKSLCPSLLKTVEAGSTSVTNQPEQAANASSYRGAVLKGREQGGEGREGQYYRNPIGNDGNKGKGLDGNRDGFSRPEAPKYKHKERFHRGYGEGSSLQGRQSGFHGPREKDRRFAPQTRDNQYRRGGNDGAQVFPEKLMLDAFKGAAQASKMSGFNENGVLDMPSKTRKALRFEEAPEAGSEPEKPTAEITEDLDGKSKSLDTVMGDAAPVTDASVAADTPLEEGEFSDSELLVDTDELQDWEQGEFEDYQE